MSLTDYDVVGAIGKGSFGQVSKIRRKADGKFLCWKEINYGHMSEKEKQMLVAEVNILRELRHTQVVRYYDRIIDRKQTKIFIVMELCEGGDVAAIIKKHKRERTLISEELVWRVAYGVLMALHDCHNRKEKILHRDLKPANVFLDKDGNVKVGDFGLARVLRVGSLFAHTNVGTPFYMSPEQVDEKAYNEKSDVWSLGCLLYEMCALSPPFDATNQIALAMKIRAGKTSRIPSAFSEDLWKVIRYMLQVEQHARPTVKDVLAQPALQYRHKQQKLESNYVTVKKKEEDNRKRETTMDAREKAVAERERVLADREAKLVEREREVARRERQCDQLYHEYTRKTRKMSADDHASGAAAGTADIMDVMDTGGQQKENNLGAPGVTVVGASAAAAKYPPGTAPSVAGGDRADIINRIRALRDN